MGRREIFAGNWKMNKTAQEAVELVNTLIAGMKEIGNREVMIFPPLPYVRELIDICKNSPISVGIQNMYYEKEGAFTGEVSPGMVKDCGCPVVLIGHSERRHVFGETNEDVNLKVKAAFEFNLDPVVCVGELLVDREKGSTNDVIKKQVEWAFKDINSEDIKKAIIAYEPVWAIGTGKVATPEIAEEVHDFIRSIIENMFGSDISGNLPILYGGSVKPDNITGLFSKENIDGVLVGGASLKADSFLDILRVN